MIINTNKNCNIIKLLLLIFLVFIFPSFGIINKVFGLPFVIILTIIMLIATYSAIKNINKINSCLNKIPLKYLQSLLIFIFISLTIAFIIFYPILDGAEFGGGRDGDNALTQAASSILNGEYPYSGKTYLGNLITHFPGAIFLAIPFHLLGNAAYQNFFWLIVFVIILTKIFNKHQKYLLLLFVILIFSPVLIYHLMVGNDYISNSIFIFTAVYFLFSVFTNNKSSLIVRLSSSFLLGFVLSSRPNFVLLFPLFFFFIAFKANYKNAFFYSLIILFGFSLVTLPFYLYNPDSFMPMHVTYKLSQFNFLIPNYDILIPILTIGLSILIPFIYKNFLSLIGLITAAFFILLFPVITGFVLSLFRYEILGLNFSEYAVFYLFFGFILIIFHLISLTENPLERISIKS